jgi:hypothetical protein
MRIVKTPLPVALGSVLALASGCSTLRPLQQPPGAVDISAVVQQIQAAIDPFWGSEKNGLPGLSSVRIALQTVHDNRVSGEADYLIVALRGYYDQAMTQEMDLTLVPQPPAKNRAHFQPPNLAQSLTQAIAAAQKQIKATYRNGDHVLNTQEIDVQLQFTVVWDVSGGLGQWKLSPISLSASDEYSRSTTDTITVVFTAPTG